MKMLFLVPFAFLFFIDAIAQTADTVVVKKPSQVVIVKTDNAQTISVFGSEDDPEFVFKSSVGVDESSNVSVVQNRLDFLHTDLFGVLSPRNSSKEPKKPTKLHFDEFDYLMGGFTCGMNESDGIVISPRFLSDITLNLESVSFYPCYKGFAITAGLDLGYRSVRMAGDNCFAKVGDNVVLASYDPAATRKMSALRYFTIETPVMLSLNARGFRIMAGIEGSYNFAGRIRTKYRLDGSKQKTREKDLQLNKLTYSYLGIVKYDWLGVYFRYTPCNVLAKGSGPDLQTYSVGIVLID